MKEGGKFILILLIIVIYDLYMNNDSLVKKASHFIHARYFSKDYLDYFNEAQDKMYSDPENSIRLVNNSIALNSSHYPSYELKLKVQKELNDRAGMMQTFERMTRIKPDDINQYIDVAEIFRNEGKLTSAMQVYTRYVTLNHEASPDRALAYYWRSYLKYQLGDYKAALEDINFCILDDAENERGFFLRALIKFAQEDYAGAIPDFEQGKNDVFLDENYIYYGVALQKIGQIREACDVWRHLGEKFGYRKPYDYIAKYCN